MGRLGGHTHTAFQQSGNSRSIFFARNTAARPDVAPVEPTSAAMHSQDPMDCLWGQGRARRTEFISILRGTVLKNALSRFWVRLRLAEG